MEIKTEADNNDITCCTRCDKPTTGMFAVSDEQVLYVCAKTSRHHGPLPQIGVKKNWFPQP